MQKLIDITAPPVSDVLDILLQDKSCKIGERKYKNIIWATDTYSEYGGAFSDTAEMTAASLSQYPDIIKPRIEKSSEEQNERTRKKAEVFTPARLCNKMNNYIDADWFGREDVFNAEKEDGGWKRTEGRIEFPKKKRWQRYIDSRRLEITCGEAPYLMSRYDVSTGEPIDIKNRIGILDRKLRIVNENAKDYAEWEKYALRALEACYGYDYQGDNVLIARINLLLTFIDYCSERWKKQPDLKLLKKAANVISRNIWQMDGLTGCVPLGKPYVENEQFSFFENLSEDTQTEKEREAQPCRIYNWRSKLNLTMRDIKENTKMAKKLFDYVIGNPPYQEENNNNNRKIPVYHHFYKEAMEIADKVELITPARFLFNAGQTPTEWNEEMLNNKHFKVMDYESNAKNIFPNQSIRGGVVITYYDKEREFGNIEIFTPYNELNNIISKIKNNINYKSLNKIIFNRGLFKFSKKLFELYPNEMKEYNNNQITSNAFKKLNFLFYDEMPNDENEYIKILGLDGNKNRIYKYLRKDFIREIDNLYKWKVIVAKSNEHGNFGEKLASPLIQEPLKGYNQTFISIGSFDTEKEAEACLKYIKTKFARAMLGILKVTPDNPPDKWKYVPLQDFTDKSDIDWSVPIPEIDAQLYKKYGLDKSEIEFIESKVKAME